MYPATQVVETEDSLGLTVCRRQLVVVDRGEGSWIWDDAGRKLLDLTSGWGVTCLGHAHPVMLDALNRQAARIIQNPNSGFTYSPARAALLQELSKVLPAGLDRIYFANSGAEANDAALKFARKITGRHRVLALSGSFHGRTLATLSVSGGQDNSARFLPAVPGNEFVGMDQIADFISADVAAVILEPVQGEGGVKAVPTDTLQMIQQLCHKSGALLIVDEVQTGFCRTGEFFAISRSGVAPDIMTMGKGIAGGLPFAAFAMSATLANSVQLGDHGGTYCGNPLMCAVSAAVVRYLRENSVCAHVRDLGARMEADLVRLKQKFPLVIKAVRGQGFMLAIELHKDALVWPLTERCLSHGVLVTPTRNGVVRLLPSLLLSEEEWRLGLKGLEHAVAEFSGEVGCTVVRQGAGELVCRSL